MVLALSIVSQLSNAILIFLCGVVLLFLLKSVNLKDKLWLASVVSILLVVLISLSQIVSYYALVERLREREAALDTLKIEYASLKSETETAHSTFGDATKEVTMSRKELEDLKSKVNAEFDRTIREIRSVYAGISDEELDRRVNNAVRKAREHLRTNVFQ